MRFSCQRCGACCRGDWWSDSCPGIPLSSQEISGIARVLDMPAESVRSEFAPRDSLLVNPVCKLQDPVTKLCRVQRAKPMNCKKWPFINLLKKPHNLRHAAEVCPGITLEPGDLPSESVSD